MDIINTIKALPQRLSAYEFSEPVEQALREYLDFLLCREELLARAQYLHDEIFENNPRNLAKFDTLEELDGREAGMLFAVVYLARYELLDAVLAKRGIPADYKEGAMFVYKAQMRKSHECYGTHGLKGMYRSAMVAFLAPWKYIIGRLTFEMDRFAGPYRIYRNIADGTLTLLAVPGYIYRENGRRLPTKYEGEAFEPYLLEEGNEIRGFAFG